MSRAASKFAKPSEKQKLTKELKITEADIEFILLAIKQSMIPGSSLEQAVKTIEKLQEIYSTLQSASTITSGGKNVGLTQRAQAKKVKEQIESEE